MYAFFQPKISVEQEEADIKEMIDEEYERKEQEHIDYYKQMEEDYYKQMENRVMTLQEYTTEELKAELKRRHDLAKAEKTKIKRCRMCKHWGKITYYGEDLSNEQYEWHRKIGVTKPCKFFKTKNGRYYRCHTPSQPACEHFEEKEI